MKKDDNSIELSTVTVTGRVGNDTPENEPFFGSTITPSSNRANIENDNHDQQQQQQQQREKRNENGGKTNQQYMDKEFNRIIFSILVPCIFIGCPFNFCFNKDTIGPKHGALHRFTTSICMKAYTCGVSLFAHGILLFWFGRSAIRMFTVTHLDDTAITDLFMLSYILAGIVALDIIWLNRRSITEVMHDFLYDQWPLITTAATITTTAAAANNADKSNLPPNEIALKPYRLYILRIASYTLPISLIAYFAFLVYSVTKSYTDLDPAGYAEWHTRSLEIITIYALFFFASDAIFLLALVWTAQCKIKQLNRFIANYLIGSGPVPVVAAADDDVAGGDNSLGMATESFSARTPEVNDIEIVKMRYQKIFKTVRKMDRAFCFYIAVYIGFLFLAIIFYVNRTLVMFAIRRDSASESVHPVANIHLATTLGLTAATTFCLLYALKEFTDVHERSSETKSILYDFVLNTKPEQRSTAFFEEVNFVVQGLLSKSTTFTLLGQIELNKRFTAHIAIIIYSYAILFHHFAKSIAK